MAELFLPVLSHFENGNAWSSSAGRLRYLVTPRSGEGASGQSASGDVLVVEVWEGPWAREFSTPEEVKTFPLSQEGLDALPAFLQGWWEAVEARPRRTLAEDIARRRAAEAGPPDQP